MPNAGWITSGAPVKIKFINGRTYINDEEWAVAEFRNNPPDRRFGVRGGDSNQYVFPPQINTPEAARKFKPDKK